MKTKPVPSHWLRREGRRLDVGPYLSGGLEAKVRLEELRTRKDRLDALTAGHNGGIFNGPQFSRRWVDDPAYGVPFVGSSSMLMADLSNLPMLRRKDAESAKLSYLRLRPGMILISCSGTIGRMVYVRPDMDGVWSSQDIMKVVPDAKKLPSGYLYAYLSSKFGVAHVISGTYGAIIQHIEPQHIAGLPVPRLGEKLERRAHELVEAAADLRASAAKGLREVGNRFDKLVREVDVSRPSPRVSAVPASTIQARFDAQFHDVVVRDIRGALATGKHCSLGEMCPTVFLPGIFKRINTDDEAQGAPYFTGATLFWLDPQQKAILSRETTLFEDVLLERGTVLVQAFGQDGGLTGRAVWVGEHLHKKATTHMLVRLRSQSLESTAYLFGFLQSDAAYRQLAVLTYGGSIPHLDVAGIKSVIVPLLAKEESEQIGGQVLEAVDGRDQALTLDRDARALVEGAIEEAS